jgi:crotonobetainyl-CoA:carnitine CoA-transferase CaiB-like acyl-CoA transferase
MARLQRAGVPASIVNTAKDVFSDPVIIDREYWHSLPHAVLGEFRVASPPFIWSHDDAIPVTSAPLLGEHTLELWTTLLQHNEEEFKELQDAGVFW